MTERNDEGLAARAVEAGDYEEAVRLLRPLAERNSEYAFLTLGWIYDTGATGTPDKDAARSYYELAASRGSAAAYHYLGWLLLNEGQEIEARKAFERGAVLDNDECRSALARMADKDSEKVASKAIKDGAYETAVGLLKPLVDRDSEYALLTLGWIYETGATGTPDYDAARSYYERATAQGSAATYLDLGRILLRQLKESDARVAFESGARRGDIACMAELGRMLVEGNGGAADARTGYVWLEKAAAQGHFFAQRTLLAIEERNAQSVFERLSIKKRIAALGAKMAKEMLSDPNSDKLR